MASEKTSRVVRISREKLLEHEELHNYVWEDGALRTGYQPVVGNLKEEPTSKEFFITALEDNSVSYSVRNSKGTIKQGNIKKSELQDELGDQYDKFRRALAAKKPHQLVPFINNLLKIESEKGQPIDDGLEASEVYRDAGRSFHIYGDNFNELYNRKFGENWTLSSDEDNETNKNTDELIKEALQVDEAALVEFKRGYVQAVWGIDTDLFSRLGFEVQKDTIKLNLYKTAQGRIAARTELNIESITNPLEGRAYNLKCKIEVDWEPNAQGELQFNSMRISGPDHEVAAKLFSDNNKKAFLKQLAPLKLSELETLKESLSTLQKWIDRMEQNNVLPEWAKSYVNKIKESFKNNLSPQVLFDEIRAITLPTLTAAESANEKNRNLLADFRNLFENSESAALKRSWSKTIQSKIDEMTAGAEVPNVFLRTLINEEQKLIDTQNFVEKMSQRWNGKEILLEAAKMDPSIYQEIVDPKITFSYVFRKIGEFFYLVKPRPTFTTEDHLAVISEHPELLDGPKKNNPYWSIWQNVSSEEKLIALSSDYLSLNDKLSLLSTYLIDPTKDPITLGEQFLSALNKEIGAALKGDDENRYMTVRDYLDRWLLKGNLHKVEWLRSEGLKEAFDEVQHGFSDSPQSINSRFKILMAGNGLPENMKRFGPQFLQTLDRDLSNLASKRLNPSYEAADLEAVKSILSVIHDNFQKHFRDFPGFQKIFMLSLSPSPAVTHEKLKIFLSGEDLNMSKDELILFLKQLNKELLTLAAKELQDPSYTPEDHEAIESIVSIIRKIQDSGSRGQISYIESLPGLEAIANIGSPQLPATKPQAEHWIEELAEAHLRVADSLKKASQEINLAVPTQPSATSVPVKSPGHHP